MKRFLSLVFARPGTGDWLHILLWLLLIVISTNWMAALSLYLNELLSLRAQLFWARTGISRGVTYSSEHAPPDLNSLRAVLIHTVAPLLVVIAAEFLVVLFGLFFLVPRKWRRRSQTVRLWWKTCLVGCIAVPAISVALTVSPLPSMSLSRVTLLVGFFAYAIYFAATPAYFARLEVVRRARRISSRCPHCRYWLRDVVADRCPECGTSVTRSPRGGFVIARPP